MPSRAAARAVLALGIAAGAAAACDGGAPASRPPSSSAGGIVDSALPPEEALRRFRAGLPVATALSGGDTSRDALVRRFIRALRSSDTAAFRTMLMNRAEFAYLYYPSSPHAAGAQRQAPDLAWFLHIQNSAKGITRMLKRQGGLPRVDGDYRCEEPPRLAGANRIWDVCTFPDAGGQPGDDRIVFGGIVARAGRYKFFSYANDY